jgi:ornithine cyclodeaminase/alanine dehydrogenase-like protein (mu-crystallin family)
MSAIRVLSAKDLRRLVSMPDAIRLMRNAFAELSSGETIVPQRMNMEMRPENSRALVMPAYSPRAKRYSIKVVTLSSNNPPKNLPFIHGLLLLFDSDTGFPLALMDAEYVTALRTGAASGLATDLLARADSCVAMIFGAGAQARTQLEGIAAVRKLDRVLVFSPQMSEAEKFCREMKLKIGLQVTPVDSPRSASEADIVCTATTSERPVFRHSDLKPGVHINGIGSYKASMREIPSETIKRSKVVVDSRVVALTEAGDLVIPMSEGIITSKHIHAEIGELVLGTRVSRITPDEITVFKSVGNAVQDLAVSVYALEIAEKNRIGSIAEI